MGPWIRLVLFGLALLMGAPVGVRACDCAYAGAPCKAFVRTPVIFAGRVKTISQISVRAAEGFDYPARLVVFEVSHAYRGLEGKTVAEVMTGEGGGDCGYDFRENESYLVYAGPHARAGRLYTSICSRTRRFAEAADDFEYLERKDNPGHAAGIEGWISEESRDADNRTEVIGALKNARVVIRGMGGRWTVTTDEQGRFKLWGLKAGTYRVIPEFAPEFIASSQIVRLRENGCEEAGFLAVPPPRPKRH